MLRSVLALVALTAVASAVAVPPYEPLPGSPGARSNSRPATPARPAPAAPVSSSTSTASNDADSGIGYSAAVDNSSAQPAGGYTASWDTFSQMQQLQQEVQQLRGMVEELKHQIDIMQKQGRERYLDLDMRINQLQGGGTKPNTAASAAGQSTTPAVTGDDKTLYEKASDLRKAGKYSESIAVLEQLLVQSPNGLYAPYSEYWLGELYMVSDPVELDKAKRHFINLLANYPDHVKVPDGMYKLGKLFASQGETSKAKSTLNELIKKHPDKSAAKLAKDLLKTL